MEIQQNLDRGKLIDPDSASSQGFSQVLADWRESLVHSIARGAVIVGLLTLIPSMIETIMEGDVLDSTLSGLAYLIVLIIAFVKLPYRFRAGGLLFVIYLLAINSIIQSGLRGDSRVYLTSLVPVALMVFGLRSAVFTFILDAVTVALTAWLVISGRFKLQHLYDQDDVLYWITAGAVILLMAYVLSLAINLLMKAFENASIRERKLYDDLLKERSLLERRVVDRTRALQTSTEVSRRLSTILDQQQLVREVVEQLRTAFGFYHAQIYLLDASHQNLQMVGGSGEAGQVMLARGHTLKIGKGLVGRAAENNEIVLVPDVAQENGWLPNSLLPETKSEVAVPIAIGSDVIGVLDVQHNVANGLAKSDAELIQSIANQVAIAVRNAQAYERAQQQADREARVISINQRIQSATSIDEVLRIAVSELGQALGARRANVELGLDTNLQK